MDTEWKYTGNLISMIDNIQWTFVVNKMYKDNDPRIYDVMENTEKMRAAAKEFGMTRVAVAREMVRLGNEALILNPKEHDEEGVNLYEMIQQLSNMTD